MDSFSTDVLPEGKTLRYFTHELAVEFQPNRRVAFGANFRFLQMNLNDGIGDGFSDSKLGDQRIFTEYRFYDHPGSSLGLAGVVKFPLYKTPTAADLQASDDPSRTVLAGDGQLDAALLLCGEHWMNEVFRLRLDTGINFRTQAFASEIPYQLAVGFVTPKMDLDLRIKGNIPLGQGDSLEGLDEVKTAFAESHYALSPAARQLIVNPSVALWVSPTLSFHFDYEMSVSGKNSANFMGFIFGLGYRWAKTKTERPRTFREVDIRKNLEGDRFEAEEALDGESGGNSRPPRYDESDIIYE